MALKCLVLLLLAVAGVEAATDFRCDGGSTVLDRFQVNDNYCDCNVDGADETLTPACSHKSQSRFACLNSGPLGQSIPMSRVWDGVCDCCDGSDEASNPARAGSADAPVCDPGGCQPLFAEAADRAAARHERIKVGLARRVDEEAQARANVQRWEETMSESNTNTDRQTVKREAVEKLEVLLKVYLRDEERLEKLEQAALAQGGACSSGDGSSSRAAFLGPCVDRSEEHEAATRVRAARAAARAERDAAEEEGGGRGGERGSAKDRVRKNSKDVKKKSKSRAKGRKAGSEPMTEDEILDVEVWVAADGTVSTEEGDAGAGEEGAMSMSLRTYVKQRREGSAQRGPPKTEAKKAEELRETALLGPVLNAGESGLYLGMNLLLRSVGLPVFGTLRVLLWAVDLVHGKVVNAAADAAAWLGLPKPVVNILEGYRQYGLPGLNRRLDYRRFPAIRSVVLRCREFFDGPGKFLVVMWDAPIALWEFLFPERDYEHQRPEAVMLREGLARAQASSKASKKASSKGGGASKRRGRRADVEKLLSLDLGSDKIFAAVAEMCLEHEERGYTYKLCPFKEAKQGKFSLGHWAGWGDEQGTEGHPIMQYDGGSRFHNDRKRSAEVVMECGPEHALISATEEEIGSYRLTMETPLVCSEASLREALRELEAFEDFMAHMIAEGASDVEDEPDTTKGVQTRSVSISGDEQEHERGMPEYEIEGGFVEASDSKDRAELEGESQSPEEGYSSDQPESSNEANSLDGRGVADQSGSEGELKSESRDEPESEDEVESRDPEEPRSEPETMDEAVSGDWSEAGEEPNEVESETADVPEAVYQLEILAEEDSPDGSSDVPVSEQDDESKDRPHPSDVLDSRNEPEVVEELEFVEQSGVEYTKDVLEPDDLPDAMEESESVNQSEDEPTEDEPELKNESEDTGEPESVERSEAEYETNQSELEDEPEALRGSESLGEQELEDESGSALGSKDELEDVDTPEMSAEDALGAKDRWERRDEPKAMEQSQLDHREGDTRKSGSEESRDDSRDSTGWGSVDEPEANDARDFEGGPDSVYDREEAGDASVGEVGGEEGVVSDRDQSGIDRPGLDEL